VFPDEFLKKNRLYRSPTHFLSKTVLTFHHGKSSQKIGILPYKKYPSTLVNARPIIESSPNVVTLVNLGPIERYLSMEPGSSLLMKTRKYKSSNESVRWAFNVKTGKLSFNYLNNLLIWLP
jgi:hypothetical protein